MNEREIIRELADRGKTNFKGIICTVDSVDDSRFLCDLLPVDGSAKIVEARLTARESVNQTTVMLPKKGSYVIAAQISRTDAWVAMCDEVEDIITLNHGDYKVENGGNIELIAGEKAVLKNAQTSVKDILNDLISELITATMGPYNFTPAVVLKLEEINAKVNQLFKE